MVVDLDQQTREQIERLVLITGKPEKTVIREVVTNGLKSYNATPSKSEQAVLDLIVWWSQKSRQFLVENKTKLNYSRKLVLSACIDLRWRLIVQRLMKPLVIVKREVRSQVAHRIWNALVIFDVNLSEGVTPSARLQNRT